MICDPDFASGSQMCWHHLRSSPPLLGASNSIRSAKASATTRNATVIPFDANAQLVSGLLSSNVFVVTKALQAGADINLKLADTPAFEYPLAIAIAQCLCPHWVSLVCDYYQPNTAKRHKTLGVQEYRDEVFAISRSQLTSQTQINPLRCLELILAASDLNVDQSFHNQAMHVTSPLLLAVAHRDLALVKLLLDHGAAAHTTTGDALAMAIAAGEMLMADEMLRRLPSLFTAPLAYQQKWRSTYTLWLNAAAQLGLLSTVMLCLRLGAPALLDSKVSSSIGLLASPREGPTDHLMDLTHKLVDCFAEHGSQASLQWSCFLRAAEQGLLASPAMQRMVTQILGDRVRAAMAVLQQ